MDWHSLKEKYPVDKDLPARAAALTALDLVLDGRQYDCLPHAFSTERTGAGEYVPLSHRRPSVRTNLCHTVVDEAVSLLFGDTHWPTVKCDSPDTAAGLSKFEQFVNLPALMLEAATRGSVGSVAFLFEAVDFIPCISVMRTAFLTPLWSKSGALVSVTERYKVLGQDLAQLGFTIPDDQMKSKYWWMRAWDSEECAVFTPALASADPKPPVKDEARTVRHGLGFVPIVWVRNLAPCSPGCEPDGECTFERAIDTVMEADYLLSQAGRGLKYSSDPTLVIKTGPPANGAPAREGGAASALTLPPEGDAKMLEINGAASEAVLNHYQELRALVLEMLHGNRAHSDKIAAAQSGRAMEMMCQSLIWLADRMRLSYGDGGLLQIYRMACAFSRVLSEGLKIDGEPLKDLDATGLSLRWPPWFPATNPELLQLAQSLVTAVSGSILSRETAVQIYATATNNPDPAGEWERVTAQLAQEQAVKQAELAAATAARKSALVGNALSHQATA